MNDIVISREKFNADLEKAQKVAIEVAFKHQSKYVFAVEMKEIRTAVYKELFAEQIE